MDSDSSSYSDSEDDTSQEYEINTTPEKSEAEKSEVENMEAEKSEDENIEAEEEDSEEEEREYNEYMRQEMARIMKIQREYMAKEVEKEEPKKNLNKYFNKHEEKVNNKIKKIKKVKPEKDNKNKKYSLKEFMKLKNEKPVTKWVSKRMQDKKKKKEIQIKKKKPRRQFNPRPYIDESKIKKSKKITLNDSEFPSLS